MHMIKDPRVENFPALVPKLEAIQYFRGRWAKNLLLEPVAVKNLKRMVAATSAGSSTRIEGADLSDEQALQVIQSKKSAYADRSAAEVFGYAEAWRAIFSGKGKNRNVLTQGQICRTHSTMMRYTDEPGRGEYRSIEVNVSDGRDGILLVCALPDLIPFFMKNGVQKLQKKWNDPAQSRLITAAEFIVELLAIHPFLDGNGRCSRLLTIDLLMKAGHDYLEFASLERQIERKKIEYYLALNKTQKSGVLDPWLHFFFDVLLDTQAAVDAALQKTVPARHSGQSRLYKTVLDIFKVRKTLGAGELARLTGKSPAGVRKVLGRLVRERILAAAGKNKGRYYQLAR
jgi:Fic family protein